MFDKELLNHIKTKLLERKQTLAVFESVTAGLLQAAFASADEAIYFFQGGTTVYNIGQKCRHLPLDPIHAVECNCVSDQVAQIMAKGACASFTADWGIGITGYATAVPESGNKVFAHYAIWNGKEMYIKKVTSDKSPALAVQLDFVENIIKDLATLLNKA